MAVDYAEKGIGSTFPNPAVGCVLVDSDNNQVLGSGFHPRSGFPHAEVFALLEAAEHVPSGIEAAESVVQFTKDAFQHRNDNDNTSGSSSSSNPSLLQQIQALSDQYKEPEGPTKLFGDCFASKSVTAYVTLEPCCHYGKTPPCAASFAVAGVKRVVVGFRDPNPRVDGGGVKMLQDNGVVVHSVDTDDGAATTPEHERCANLVTDFCKRITPRDEPEISGAKRRTLRKTAHQWKTTGELPIVGWPETAEKLGGDPNEWQDRADNLELDPRWMEELDKSLWKKELVLLRLQNAVAKKKGCKILGERIAKELGAHLAQTVGHTALLYRPGVPPVLDLDTMAASEE